jgi:RNA polymerase sigma factor (sigma-70 family)
MKTPPAPAVTDSELVALARQGDREAYGELVSRHQTLVASLAYSFCGDFARSQDIAQEAFLAAWRQLTALEDPEKFKAWLCGIARNLAYHHRRQQTRHPGPGAAPDVFEPVAEQPDPREQAVAREEAELVWRALAALPETYREPLILFYREHHSVARVAGALELSEETVKQRLTRGRRQLRHEVEKLIDRSLGTTAPGATFTAAVVAALPAATQQAAATAAAAVVGKGGAIAKGATAFAWLSVLATPFVSLAGLIIQSRLIDRTGRPAEERKFMRGLIWAGGGVGTLFLFILAGYHFWQSRSGLHPLPLATFAGLLLGGLVIATVVPAGIFFRRRRQFAEYVRRTQLPAHYSGWRRTVALIPARAVHFRSKATLLGLPLVDIRFGRSAEEPLVRGTAVGWIAMGDIAHGVVFAFGGCAIGGIAVGGIGIGGLSFGGAALGLFAFGGAAAGGFASGILFAAGYVALAPIALGWEAASGILAIARHAANGAIAFAGGVQTHRTDPWAQAEPLLYAWEQPFRLWVVKTFLPALLIPAISLVATNAFARHPRPPISAERRLQPAFLLLLALACAGVVGGWSLTVRRFTASLAARDAATVVQAREAVRLANGDEARARGRFELGKVLARARQRGEALAEFLWCFDEGMRNVPALAGVRVSELPREIATLGQLYPPAIAALRERRDRAAAALRSAEADRQTIWDFVSLNEVLGESEQSLALYRELPASHPRRDELGGHLFRQFLSSRQYADAVRAAPIDAIRVMWDGRQRAARRRSRATLQPAVQQRIHQDDIHWIADRLEVYAGARQMNEARELLTLALGYDATPTARAVYRESLERAGVPAMMDSTPR